jgi:hypothetical protein
VAYLNSLLKAGHSDPKYCFSLNSRFLADLCPDLYREVNVVLNYCKTNNLHYTNIPRLSEILGSVTALAANVIERATAAQS